MSAEQDLQEHAEQVCAAWRTYRAAQDASESQAALMTVARLMFQLDVMLHGIDAALQALGSPRNP